jgi:hypothetical protein
MIVILIYMTVLVSIIYIILKHFSNIQCGGRIDPTLRFCDSQSNLVSGRKIPEDECNPMNDLSYNLALSQFISYIGRIIRNSKEDLYQAMRQDGFDDIIQGSFYFAIPPLLKLLDSDFGQNQIAPYGILSFPDTYIDRCVSDPQTICDRLQYPKLCTLFFQQRKQNGLACPFDVSDTSQGIEDVRFFNTLGILGTFSLNAKQMIVMYYDLPLSELQLNYWSFNIYLADRVNNSQTCSPMRQTYLASILQPMNCFMTPAISGKKFNPLTGKGDVVEDGHIRMYILIGLDSQNLQNMKTYLSKRGDSDIIHIFQLPTKMSLDPSIPNPNHLTSNDLMYNPETDRLSVFLRLSPYPNKHAQDLVKNYITNTSSFAQVLLVSLRDGNTSGKEYNVPLYIAPVYNEKEHLESSFKDIVKIFKKNIKNSRQIPTRSTILNIFAPLYPGLLATTTRKYKGGYQAIQLAGIGQGDNPDTQYRLSGSVCLSPQDVMVSISINHALYGNCIYNNINLIDRNKAYGYASVTLDQDSPYDVYIILAGRDRNEISSVHEKIMGKFTNLRVAIYEIFIPTKSNIDDGIPICHQILMTERVYVNRRYTNQDKSKFFMLDNVFGKDMKDIINADDTEAWENLMNVTAPDVDTLIPPTYIIVKKSHTYNWVIILFFIIFFILTVISNRLWTWKRW